ncbi:hypothetical protein LQZ24_06105 [Fructobacillus sp. M1-13]|uniref:Uncharacterized protein n=1 Tax=Fructobacillus papyriferae TaxID=2713171 RepID=A0ABS5QPE4_9LACO|nr:hypothetical protein [Fructobacillus papyriferae]MBS9334946.1 hypothetical protein [Fructobacillus papyriferae]MCD2159570.1 hypothetical protein [Fructobacillus papyriferae]
MPTEAHIFIESALLPHKNQQGVLDSIEGEMTAVGLAKTLQKSKPHHSLYQKARLVARDKETEKTELPIIVIGNEAAVNEVLSGFLAVDQAQKRPVLLYPLVNGKSLDVHQMMEALLTALNNWQITKQPMAVLTGNVPNQGNRYFLDYLQVGPDFSALLPTFNQRLVWKYAWQQFLDFWNLFSRNQDKVTFAWTLRNGHNYQHNAKTLGLQVMVNQEGEKDPFTVRMVNQVAWPKILLTYLQGKKGRENPSRRGFITFPLDGQSDFHIRDLQRLALDGNQLENGAYSFTLKQAGSYPILELPVAKRDKKKK